MYKCSVCEALWAAVAEGALYKTFIFIIIIIIIITTTAVEPAGCIVMMPVEFLCTQRLCIQDRAAQTWHGRSWHPYCRRGFRNEIIMEIIV